ncbi:MAG TPA: hypothetical protein VE966_13960 [Gemmatimonadales bacterium]|nr:hypothetical protein [Gemmatimonadales bacterium]
MHLDFAVVADYAIVDQAGKLSVLGIFQHIWVQQFPAMHPRLHLVLRLKGKRGVLKLEWDKTRASIPFSAK